MHPPQRGVHPFDGVGTSRKLAAETTSEVSECDSVNETMQPIGVRMRLPSTGLSARLKSRP